MLARAVTYAVVGLEPRRVEVEADLVTAEMPVFAIVGLADRACQEAKHRVQSSVVNSLLSWPWKHRITVNLAPAALRKEGSGFDLPIALAVLAGYRQLPLERLLEHVCVGELALDGRIRPVVGTIAVAEGARRASVGRLLCAAESASEAALAGVEVVPVRHLAQAVAYLRGEEEIRAAAPPGDDELEEPSIPDWPTSGGKSGAAGPSSSRPQASTICCSRGRPALARRCSAGACRASCPRSRGTRRSR